MSVCVGVSVYIEWVREWVSGWIGEWVCGYAGWWSSDGVVEWVSKWESELVSGEIGWWVKGEWVSECVNLLIRGWMYGFRFWRVRKWVCRDVWVCSDEWVTRVRSGKTSLPLVSVFYYINSSNNFTSVSIPPIVANSNKTGDAQWSQGTYMLLNYIKIIHTITFNLFPGELVCLQQK